MHGIIFLELKNYMEKNYSQEIWKQILQKSNLDKKDFTTIESYPDKEIFAILQAAVEITEKPLSVLLEGFGEYLGLQLLNSSKLLLDPKWSLIDLLDNTQQMIHTVVMKSLHHSSPPFLKTERVNPNEIIIYYKSPRRLCDLAKGIIRGMAKEYQTAVKIEEPECMHRGNDQCKMIVHTYPI